MGKVFSFLGYYVIGKVDIRIHRVGISAAGPAVKTQNFHCRAHGGQFLVWKLRFGMPCMV